MLLLDDDPAIGRMVQSCLSRNGYSVTLAASGAQGIREVMANDFAVILCDMMMPALSGDMFYRAVERTRPSLCSRILFITGHGGDSNAREFIKSVNGRVLLKPFDLPGLVDAVAFAALCGFFAGWTASTIAPRLEAPPANAVRTLGISPARSRPASCLASGELEKPPFSRMDLPAAEAAPESPKGVRRAGALKYGLLGAALLALAAVPVGYYLKLEEKVDASSARRSSLQDQWDKIPSRQPDLTRARGELQALQNVQKRLAEDHAKPHWMPALHTLTKATPPEIDLKRVSASTSPDVENPCRIEIGGLCVADNPRALADIFRESLKAKLSSLGAEGASAQHDRLEEVTDTLGQPDPRRVSFDIVIRTGPIAPKTTKTEGQP